MRLHPTVAFGVAFAFLAPLAGPAAAWGPVGRQVIALIAWDTLSEPTRAKVVDLMQQAPPEPVLPEERRCPARLPERAQEVPR